MLLEAVKGAECSEEAKLRSVITMRGKSWRRTKSVVFKEKDEQASENTSPELSPSKPAFTPLKWKTSPSRETEPSFVAEENVKPDVRLLPPQCETFLDPVGEMAQEGAGHRSGENVEDLVDFKPVDLDQKYREQAELMRNMEQENAMQQIAERPPQQDHFLGSNLGSPEQESRKLAAGQDSAAMTIEFLRARLLSERSASRAANQRAQQLSRKVEELEQKLAAEIDMRKKAEVSLEQALESLKQAQLSTDDGPPELEETPSLPKSDNSLQVGDDGLKTQQAGSDTPAIKFSSATDERELEAENNNGDMKGFCEDENQLVRDNLMQEFEVDEGCKRSKVLEPPVLSTDISSDPAEHLKQRQEMRAAIEERLRAMWNQIGEEMAALAEVRSQEELVRLELMGWMGRVPDVLQDKKPETSVGGSGEQESLSDQEGDASSTQTAVDKERGLEISDDALVPAGAQDQEKYGGAKEACFTQTSEVKRLVDQYKAQETAQNKWEENFKAQQSIQNSQGSQNPLPRTAGPPSVLDSDCQVQGTNLSSLKACNMDNEAYEDDGAESSSGHLIGNGIVIENSNSTGSAGSSDAEGERSRRQGNGLVGGDLMNIMYRQKTQREGYGHRQLGRTARDTYSILVNEQVGRGGMFDSPYTDPTRGALTVEGLTMTKEILVGAVESDGGRQGWPVREVVERASHDVYYAPSSGVGGVDVAYSNPEKDGLHGSQILAERLVEETLYRNSGRWEPQVVGSSWRQSQDDREIPDLRYRRAGNEGGHGVPLGYPDRARFEREQPYPPQDGEILHKSVQRTRSEGIRGMNSWQEGEIPGVRNTVITLDKFRYPQPPYIVEDPRSPHTFIDGGGFRREVHYPSQMTQNSRSYYAQAASGGLRVGNGYIQPEGGRAYTGWEAGIPREDRSAGIVPPEIVVGDLSEPSEPSEVLRALNMAKQQIKRSTVEPGCVVSSPYTLASDHRYGMGMPPSKPGYTVETPMIYSPGSKKSLDAMARNVSFNGYTRNDLFTGTGHHGQSSYVEKLNVGSGIEFFF